MKPENILSPTTGAVWKIEVAVGATVAEGDVLMVIESMKMEIPVEAPAAGTVTAIGVREGEQVQEDQVLATVQAA